MLGIENGNEIDNLTVSVLDGRYLLHYLLNVKDNPAIFDSVSQLVKYYKSEKIGSGNFCDVYRGKVTIENKEVDAAVKICHPPNNEVSPRDLLEARTSMINEVKMMARYRDENLIKFYGVACDRPPVMIVMELCSGGSLDSHLRARGKSTSDTEKLIYLYEASWTTSSGMRYLHSVNCVHRDLAARNCLISREGTIKVSDFGLSVILENGKTMCRSVLKEAPIRHKNGDFRWLAPECCYKKPLFSKKSDVWAFGTLMFEVFSNGSKPFLDYEDLAIIRAIRKAAMPPPPPGTPVLAASLLKQIWSVQFEKCDEKVYREGGLLWDVRYTRTALGDVEEFNAVMVLALNEDKQEGTEKLIIEELFGLTGVNGVDSTGAW
ncbi:protein tyrosine kinase [Ostertagia ostertagi]